MANLLDWRAVLRSQAIGLRFYDLAKVDLLVSIDDIAR